ncbi:MAG: hypothetical protein AAB897_00745 [Patescibacteria group bacterium]
MSTRSAKQIIYGAFFLIILGAIFTWVYFLYLEPVESCFDGILNQNEQGIDCGGVCANACLPVGLKALQTVDRVLTFRPTSSNLSILARVSNPNLDHAAKSFRYTFSLSDPTGKVVATFSGNSFLYAREVKYILLPNVPTPAEAFTSVSFKAQNAEWVVRDEFPGPPTLTVSGLDTRVEGNNLIVEGRVTNGDILAFSELRVIALFQGQFGQLAGASETIIDRIVPNETKSFSIIYPAIPNADLAGTKVFVYAR